MVYERVKAVVRNETFEDCEGVCYGVPLLPEDEEAVQHAVAALAEVLGTSEWLAGVGGVLRKDGQTMEIEVRVLPGHELPFLPPRWYGYPLRTVYHSGAVAREA